MTGPAMTNPSTQTMLERSWIVDLIRNTYDQAPSHYKKGDDWDDGAETIADIIIARAASALAAVWDRTAIALTLYDLRFPHRNWSMASTSERALTLKQADAILALATPEEAPTAAGEARWTEDELALAFFDYSACVKGRCTFNKSEPCRCATEAYKAVHLIKHVLPRSMPLYAAPPAAQTDGVRETKALREFVGWIESWVSNPVGSYSVSALDGLFCTTRSKIAAISPSPQETAP